MGLFDNKDVYCQMCGGIIPDMGYASDAKKIYHTNSKCIPWATPDDNTLEARNKEEIQQDIMKGKIIHYGKLEKKCF